jgi:hypothetical protein
VDFVATNGAYDPRSAVVADGFFRVSNEKPNATGGVMTGRVYNEMNTIRFN